MMARILAGALTGFVVGLTGVGGGALMTPLLVLLFGVAPAAAVGTDLWYAAITKGVATRIYHGHGLIDWPIVRRLWLGSLPASAAAMLLLKSNRVALLWMRPAIGGAILLTAVGLLVQLRGPFLRRPAFLDRHQKPLTLTAGAVLGLLVTLTSVGAGALGSVLLVAIYGDRLSPRRLVGTDVVHAIPLALFAGLGHLILGDVNPGLLGILLCGSIPGVLAGASLSARMPQRWIRLSLAMVLAVTAMRMF